MEFFLEEGFSLASFKVSCKSHLMTAFLQLFALLSNLKADNGSLKKAVFEFLKVARNQPKTEKVVVNKDLESAAKKLIIAFKDEIADDIKKGDYSRAKQNIINLLAIAEAFDEPVMKRVAADLLVDLEKAQHNEEYSMAVELLRTADLDAFEAGLLDTLSITIKTDHWFFRIEDGTAHYLNFDDYKPSDDEIKRVVDEQAKDYPEKVREALIERIREAFSGD